MAFHLDRTDEKAAKLRYDNSNEVVVLKPQPGPTGRTDYTQPGGRVLLHVFTDGRVVIYHRDRPDGIDVRRDDLKREARPAGRPKKDQPPDVKLRLGHYASGDGAMAFVLDRRDDRQAKLRYDNTTEPVTLRPQAGPAGRIDFLLPDGSVLLHVFSDGRVVIFHRDRPDGIAVSRDGDADAL